MGLRIPSSQDRSEDLKVVHKVLRTVLGCQLLLRDVAITGRLATLQEAAGPFPSCAEDLTVSP